MATAVLDFGSFSPTQKQELLTALQAEVVTRITGRVQSGSSAGQNYAMNMWCLDDINRLINGLTADLGLSNSPTRARPDWSHAGYPPSYGPDGGAPA